MIGAWFEGCEVHLSRDQVMEDADNHLREETPARPACNPERTRATTTTPTELDLGRYVKELEGKGRKPDELL